MRMLVTRARSLPQALPMVYETPKVSYLVALIFFLIGLAVAATPMYLDMISKANLAPETPPWIPQWIWYFQISIVVLSCGFFCAIWLNRLHMVIVDSTVYFEISGLIGRERWQEPLSAYRGIAERIAPAMTVPAAGDFKGFRLLLHEIILKHHSDARKDVKLAVKYSKSFEPSWSEEQIQGYCGLLKLPKLDPIVEPETKWELSNLVSG